MKPDWCVVQTSSRSLSGGICSKEQVVLIGGIDKPLNYQPGVALLMAHLLCLVFVSVCVERGAHAGRFDLLSLALLQRFDLGIRSSFDQTEGIGGFE